MIGKTLAHYEVTEQLGSGGMGEVYRATDGKLGREVAIKVLPEAFATDPERVARFEREAKLLAALNHPNVAAIYGFEKADTTHFLVLELVEGETLADRLSRGPMSPSDALHTARQIVDAIEAAHERGVIHRDLKPANIKITPEGKVKVLDFGLAKAFSAEQPNTQLSQSPTLSIAATNAGVILGTAAYMSPEQAKGSLKIDNRTDIFSLGCVLYEMFTGRQTFHGDSVPEVLASVLAREADLTRLPPNLNPRLHELIRRCLEKDPKKRWHAVGDVRVELEAVASDTRGIEVQSPSATGLSRKKVAGLVLAGIVFGFAVAGALAWSLRPAADVAITRFPFVLPDDQNFSRTRSQVSAISPDGSMMVYVANRQLYLKRLSELESSPIRGTDLDVSSPFFSPDGQSIAFFSFQDAALKRIAVTGGAPLTLCAATTLAYGMQWAGNTIMFAQGGREILAVPDGGGKPEVWIKAEGSETISSPQLLPGNDLVMFSVTKTGAWDKADIVVQSRKSGKRTVLISGGSGARYVPTGHIVYALDTTLLAAPLNIDQLKVGSPVPVVEGISRSNVNLGTANFDFSRNGTLTYVSGLSSTFSELRALAIADRTGKTRPIPGLAPASYYNPRVSPDGKQIAVEMTDDASIQIYDLSGKTQLRKLTLEGLNYAPVWSPDSKQVAFRSRREEKLGVFIQNADGTGIAQRLTSTEAFQAEYPFSWHGDTLLYTPSRAGNGAGISTLSITDRKIASFANESTANQFNASFSADGRWVAYVSNEAQRRFQIFMKQFPMGLPKYQVTRVSSEAPVWSPKTNELFYFDVDAAQLKAVRVQFEPSFSVSEAVAIPIERLIQALNGVRQYDVMPDGQHFLVMQLVSQPTGAKAPQIHVVLNWFEELKKLPIH